MVVKAALAVPIPHSAEREAVLGVVVVEEDEEEDMEIRITETTRTTILMGTTRVGPRALTVPKTTVTTSPTFQPHLTTKALRTVMRNHF